MYEGMKVSYDILSTSTVESRSYIAAQYDMICSILLIIPICIYNHNHNNYISRVQSPDRHIIVHRDVKIVETQDIGI